MKLKKIKATWGMAGPIEQQLAQIAEAGYDGVEAPLIFMEDRQRFSRLLAEHKLDLVAQVVSYGPADAWRKHADEFTEQMHQAADMGALLVDCHGGRDAMSFEDQCRYYEIALKVEQETGVPVGHETHRGRPTYTPWTTAKLLKHFPELRITADISHWLCVCESYLDDMQEHLDLAAERAIHIHARVGHPQGPQVPHPGAPEYEHELNVHEAFWDKVLSNRLKSGVEYATFTPEFGPPGYMPTLPFTKQPVSDLWEVCMWMRNRFEHKFATYFQS